MGTFTQDIGLLAHKLQVCSASKAISAAISHMQEKTQAAQDDQSQFS